MFTSTTNYLQSVTGLINSMNIIEYAWMAQINLFNIQCCISNIHASSI